MKGSASVKSVSSSGINETAVESFVITCIGIVLFIPSFFIAPALFNILGYAFCLLGIILGIYAIVETVKTKNPKGRIFGILGICVGVLAPVIIIVVRLVLGVSVFM